MVYVRTPYARGMQDPIEQPMQFDHRHHTRDEGIDCRYCHNTVDKSPCASIPPTQLCLNCHSQVWNKSPLLEPVRQSFFQNKPIEWRRVYKRSRFRLLQPRDPREQGRRLRRAATAASIRWRRSRRQRR